MIDHFGFGVSDYERAKAFYAEALAPLGIERPQYHPNYYGAFVLDFDGHNIEVVCHRPE
jgi:catechol 2,3-dioxygenase-like lactoylglutathione lyase family enzyme